MSSSIQSRRSVYSRASVQREMDIRAIVEDLSQELDTGLSGEALVDILDLLRAGVSTTKIIAMVQALRQASGGTPRR